MNNICPCRTYIVYRNALFAQGVRSMLAQENGVQIVGMEDDMAKASKAVRALHPEVILMEEPMESGVAWPFLEWANASRIVTFSLKHAYATVYDPHRTAAGDPADLVKAIQGAGKPHIPRLDQPPGKGAMADLLESGPYHRAPLARESEGEVKGANTRTIPETQPNGVPTPDAPGEGGGKDKRWKFSRQRRKGCSQENKEDSDG